MKSLGGGGNTPLPGIVDRHVEFEGFRVHALVALDHVQLIRVRALLGAGAITGTGSTWSPRNNGCGLYLEPAQ